MTGGGDELDLRLLRYFTAVARHGTFGQAAAALRVAQPSLSRQIQRLEAQVGATLLARTARGSTLTPAGQQLLAHADDLLTRADRAVADARAAGGPEHIALGHSGNLVITPVALALRRGHPAAEVRTVAVDGLRPERSVTAGQVDALIARGPLPAGALEVLHTVALYDEPRSLVVPVGHRLAERGAVHLADFADEPLVRFGDPVVDAWWRIDPRPDGRPAPDGPLVTAFGEKFERVAAGEALVVLASSPAATGFRSDLVAVPILDVDPTPVLLITRAEPPTPLVAEARAVALDLLGDHRESVPS